jgi:hypothetical protein
MKARMVIYNTESQEETELLLVGMDSDDLDTQYSDIEESLKYTEKVIREYYYI